MTGAKIKLTAMASLSGALMLGLAGLGAVPARAGQQIVTYSAVENIPAPPATNFAGSSGGDGWGLAFTPDAVYNVFHHSATLQVACHLQADASSCAGYPKTITDPVSGDDFSSAAMPGLWVNPATQHLYVFATEYDPTAPGPQPGTAGVVCLDTTQPASDANPFCGFTTLSGADASPLSADFGISGVSDPVIAGHRWYAFNYVQGQAPGSGDGVNQLLCFDLSTLAGCSAQPYTVDLGPSGTNSTISTPEPGIAALGNEIVVPDVTSTESSGAVGCLNVSTGSSCGAGSPITLSTASAPGSNDYPPNYAAPFPSLTPAGQVNGS